MYRDLRVAVVVPAHNEERLVGTVIRTSPDLVDHIIVVDDASPDGTAEAARAVGDPRAEVITLEVNQGVGGAILAGHRRALELGADVSVVMAGDAQMDPAYLPTLLDPIADGTAQFTKANRFYGPGTFEGMPRYRIVGNIVMSFMTKAASGYWNLFDPLNGYTAIHRSALEPLDLDRIAKRYDFENDLLVNLNILRVRARDVPIPAVYGDEVSGLKLAHRRAADVRAAVQGLLAPDLVEVRPPVVLPGRAAALLGPGPGRVRHRRRHLHHPQHPRAAGRERGHGGAVRRPAADRLPAAAVLDVPGHPGGLCLTAGP